MQTFHRTALPRSRNGQDRFRGEVRALPFRQLPTPPDEATLPVYFDKKLFRLEIRVQVHGLAANHVNPLIQHCASRLTN